MSQPQILLIGSQLVDKHDLMCSIVGRQLDPGALGMPWRIDTKYYTADVQLQIADLEGGVDQDAASLEAVVLVFDAAKHETFASLRQWWEGQQADPAVKLAVASGAWGHQQQRVGSELLAEPWLEEAQDWCAEQLIEYVEVAQQQEQGQQQQQQQNKEAEEGVEAEGVQRVIEALHAHTWPGLRLKPRGSSGSGRLSAPLPAAEQGSAAAAALPAAAEQVVAPAARENGRPAAPAELPANGLDAPEEPAEEMDLLFAELAGARGRLQQMGDTERREAAAALMLRLMGALGLDDDADSEADSEGEVLPAQQ